MWQLILALVVSPLPPYAGITEKTEIIAQERYRTKNDCDEAGKRAVIVAKVTRRKAEDGLKKKGIEPPKVLVEVRPRCVLKM